MKKILTSLLLSNCLLVAPFATAETIRIASEGAYAPFNTIDASGELAGFDIEIANALCVEMKVECTIVAQDWDGIIPGLMARKYDAIIASMSITPERLKVVDFTDKYYSNKLSFVAAKDKAVEISKEGLKGMSVGAQRATIAGQTLEDTYSDVVSVKLYDTQDNAYLDLVAGRLDAILSDKFPAYDWLETEDGQAFEFKGDDLAIDDEIGIAVRKGDKLKERFNKALTAIVADGTYEEINKKYFPFSIY